MKLTDFLDERFIIPSLKADAKKSALEELVSVFALKYPRINRDGILEVLLEREKLGSTGIGDGVAIPHGKVNVIDELVVSFGRSERGIDFDSTDSQRVHLFFLLVAPEKATGYHLKALAKISRLLKDREAREKLLKADTKKDIYQIISENDRDY
jgi:PTS system nitrogen regulatory IIA component